MRGEPEAVDTALLASILRNFTGEKDLALTIRGKAGSSSFEFDFSGQQIVQRVAVSGAIVEVDAGFEGDSVWLMEAKARNLEDFIIRQLYYPLRLWSSKVRKPVRSLFLSYTNRVFGLYEYTFQDLWNYHSIKLVRSGWYTFDEPQRIPSLDELFSDTKSVRPPGEVPFPQADTLGSVVDTIELYATHVRTAAEVADSLAIDPRQGDYYSNAAAWLGFLEKRGSGFVVTEMGRKFSTANRGKRFRLLFDAVACRSVFREVSRERLAGHEMAAEEVVRLIQRFGYNRTTARRRSRTVLSWLRYLWAEHERLAHEAES